MVTSNISGKALASQLLELSKNRFKGQLFVESAERFWTFYLDLGWIFYATGATTTKWQSRLLLYCPQLQAKNLLGIIPNHEESSDCWQHHLLFSLAEEKIITREQAEQVIWVTVAEALHEVLYESAATLTAYPIKPANLSVPPLRPFNPEKLLSEVKETSLIWQSANLPDSDFDLAPVLRQQSLSYEYKNIARLLDGRHTVWDIAARAQEDIIQLTRSLTSSHQAGVIDFVEISDLYLPLKPEASKALALSQRLQLSPNEKQSSTPPKKSPPRRARGLIVLGGAFLSLLLLGGVSYLASKSQILFHKPLTPVAKIAQYSDIQLSSSMREVPKVPKGLFNYGGALLFAPLRSQKDIDAMAQAQPQFHLRYVDPVFGRPGSHKGVSMLLNNELAFSQNALPLNDSEYSQAKARGFSLQEVPVGIDAVTFFTHPGLTVPGLSVDQLQGIYTGIITNWNQVGGPNLPIVPITIDPKDSSTIAMLMQNLPGGINAVRGVQIARDYTASIRQVSNTPGGISFGSVGTVKGQRTIRPLAIAKFRSTEYVNPYMPDGQINAQAIRDSAYPLTRNIFVVIRRDNTPSEQAGVAYTNLLLSAEGQKLVENAGFVPLH